MIHIQRPLPFILASTNIGTMIVNYLDKCETPNGTYGVGYQFLQTGSFDFYEVESVVAFTAYYKLFEDYTCQNLNIRLEYKAHCFR